MSIFNGSIWKGSILKATINPSPTKAKLAVIGDSISSAGGGPDSASVFLHGWPTWLLNFSNGYFEYELNEAVGGWTTSDMLSTGVPAVLASEASWCVLFGGANDITNDIAASAIISNVISIIEQLISADMQVVVVVPYATNNVNSSSRAEEYYKYCDFLRKLRFSYPQVIVCDVASQVNDSESQYPNAYGLITHDGTHPSNHGAGFVGLFIADEINKHIDGGYQFSSDPNDILNGLSANNILMTGNAGSVVNGTTGDVADGFTLAKYPSESGQCKGVKIPRRFVYPLWSGADSVAVGNIRLPTESIAAKFGTACAYIAISVTGATGVTEPAWPFFDATVVDGGVTWKGIEFPIRREPSLQYSVGSLVLPEFQNSNQQIALLCTASSGMSDAGSFDHSPQIGSEKSDGNITWMTVPMPDGVAGDWQLIDFEGGAVGYNTSESPSLYSGNFDLPATIVAGDDVRLAVEIEYDKCVALRSWEIFIQSKDASGATLGTHHVHGSSSQYGAVGYNLDGRRGVHVSNVFTLPPGTVKARYFVHPYARKLLARVGRGSLVKVS